jgi:hypothetical protein
LDLKPIIEGRRPLPDPEDDLYEDVMAGVELFLTMFEHVGAAADTMSPEVGRQWQAYIRDIAAGVAFRAYLGGKPMDWYSPGFLKYVGYDASTLGVAPASPDAGVPSTPGPRNRSTSPP